MVRTGWLVRVLDDEEMNEKRFALGVDEDGLGGDRWVG